MKHIGKFMLVVRHLGEVVKMGLSRFIYYIFKFLSGFRIKKKYEMSWTQLKEMLSENENMQEIVLWDGLYKYSDFSDMLRIIKNDIVRFNKYRAEEYDCDNFAMTFTGLVPFLYGVNNVGIAVGRIVDDNGKVSYHAWNVILARKTDGTPMLYMYEPQTGTFTTYKSGRFGKVRYEPVRIIWG